MIPSFNLPFEACSGSEKSASKQIKPPLRINESGGRKKVGIMD